MDRKYQCCSQISGLIILLFLGALPYAAKKENATSQFDREIRAKSGSLDSVRVELEKGRAKLKDLQKEEGNYLEKLEQLEKNIGASRSYLQIIGLRIDTVEQTIENLQDSLEQAQTKLGDRQSVMKKRLRQAYMSGNPQLVLLLLTSRSPLEIINRARYIEELNRYDQGLVNDINQTKARIDISKQTRQVEYEKLTALLADKKDEQEQLVKEENDRRAMLDDVRSKKKSYMAMISELEAAQKELNNILKLLEKKKKTAKEKEKERLNSVAFEKKKGKLPWPVEGKVIAGFGKVVHPVYKTVIMNNGIDIGAKQGDAVQCVANGTVIHVGWMRGLGKLVIIDHSGGFITIYAHLDSINVVQAQKLELGSVIGSVGETGSLGGAQLHFEIRNQLNPSTR